MELAGHGAMLLNEGSSEWPRPEEGNIRSMLIKRPSLRQQMGCDGTPMGLSDMVTETCILLGGRTTAYTTSNLHIPSVNTSCLLSAIGSTTMVPEYFMVSEDVQIWELAVRIIVKEAQSGT